MKRHCWTLSFVGLTLLLFSAVTCLAQGSNRGETKATIDSANVAIEYGRPFLRGRDPMKMLQPGSLWRLGSSAPTTITSDADLDFAGTRVPKGKHILLARLAEGGKWWLLVSSKNAFEYEPNAKIAEVPIESQDAKDSVEQLTLTLSNKKGRGVIEIAWGTSRLLASFTPAK
jgi:hypothetical protein